MKSIKNYIISILLALSIFLFIVSCTAEANNGEKNAFVEPIKRAVAESVYWDNAFGFKFKKLEGKIISCEISITDQKNDFDEKMKFYTVCFNNIPHLDSIFCMSFYGAGKDIWNGGSCGTLNYMKKEKLCDIEVKLPDSFRKAASTFDETYIKQVALMKPGLLYMAGADAKLKKHTYYVGPFNKYSSHYIVYWEEGKYVFDISRTDEETMMKHMEAVTRVIEEKDVIKAYITNCKKDGKKIVLYAK